jgi:mevalonate pyrophosphate decarboxylase
MKSHSKAIAYPGLPVIFAEGFRDYKKRISGHSHASFAITDAYNTVRTETKAEAMKYGVEFTLDGSAPDDMRSSGALTLIRDMIPLATEEIGIHVESVNHGILTGSSDSGAAALVTAVDDLLELNLPLWRMVELARHVSETAYRSLIGGLSEYRIDEEGNVRTVQMKKASHFKDVMIYAVPFNIKRFSADDLHLRVVRHPDYSNRVTQVNYRLENLRNFLEGNDILGVLDIMESEASTVHTMFKDMGMGVIKPEMKAVLDLVSDMRSRGVQAYWNVAGGSNVYVLTLRRWAKEVTRELKDKNFRYKHFKVADGATVV